MIGFAYISVVFLLLVQVSKQDNFLNKVCGRFNKESVSLCQSKDNNVAPEVAPRITVPPEFPTDAPVTQRKFTTTTERVTEDAGPVLPPTTPKPNVDQLNADYCRQNNDYFLGYCSGKSGQVEQAVYNFCYDYSKRCKRPMPLGLSIGGGVSPTGVNQPNNQAGVNRNLPPELLTQTPLGGLGGMNPSNMQQYGGPVQGGLGIGKGLQVPFFGASEGTNVVPTQGFQTGKGFNAAGIGVQSSSGVNWGGLPGVSTLNNALGLPPTAVNGMQTGSNIFGSGRRKRRMTFVW